MQGFPQEFFALQNARHQADYSYEANRNRKDMLAEIDKLDVMFLGFLNFTFVVEMNMI